MGRPRAPRQLRVCISTYAPGHGGLQSLTGSLCRYLTGAGFDVTPVYLARPVSVRSIPAYLWSSKPRWEAAWGRNGIALDHFSHLEVLRYLVPALKARTVLRGFDVYQVIRGANLGESLFALSGYRFVDWVATTIADERRTQGWSGGPGVGGAWCVAAANRATYRLLLRQEGWMLRQAARVCAISRYVRDRIIEAHDLPAGSVEVMPLPVDTERFVPGPDKRSRAGERSLLSVGRLDDPRKNLGLLLDAFGRVRSRVPGVTLRLAGPLTQKAWLDSQIERLSLTNAVIHVGEVDVRELVRLYQEADVVVLSSRQEGFGLVLAEAMACGTPVVATRCGGPEDIVLDGVTGFLVSRDDPTEMAAALERLLADRGLRERMGQAGRDHACRTFSAAVIGARVLEMYRQVYPDIFSVECQGLHGHR